MSAQFDPGQGVVAALPLCRVAYLVNQYPKVSHTFIRREIVALEQQGVEVRRFAIRGWDAGVADAHDRDEQQRTRYVLHGGVAGLANAVLRQLLSAPLQTLRALLTALRLGHRGDRPWPYHVAYWAEACVVARWLKEAGAWHLHAHFGTNAAEVALLVHELGGSPFSFTVHGPEEFDKPHALKLADKVAAAAFVVAISSYGRSQVWRWSSREHWPKVNVVHCGVDQSFREAVLSPVPGAAQLVCIGRLCEQKGQLLLVEAAARVVAAGVPLRLVLAGDGEMRGEVEARIASLGLREHVEITGWVDAARVRAELSAARALVLPSFAEGLPVVLMEAMAMRRPVITTAVAGIPELVRPGAEGWLVPAGDLDALVEAMQACLAADPAELDAMGRRARQRVLERHDVDRETAKLAALFGMHGAHGAVG